METKQTLKEVLALWKDAVASYNSGDSERCLQLYSNIEEKSGRIYYNMGCAYNKLNQRKEAVLCFTKAVTRDPYLAIGFYQRGVLHLECKRLDEAMSDFIATRLLLRGNTFIYYKQLGLLYKLQLCEILYNMALILIFKGDDIEAEKLLSHCEHEMENKHRVHVSIAQQYLQGRVSQTDLLTPMTISPDVTFTPPKDVVDNLNKKNVMGKAKVVSAVDINDLDPAFNGPRRVEELKRAVIASKTETVKSIFYLSDTCDSDSSESDDKMKKASVDVSHDKVNSGVGLRSPRTRKIPPPQSYPPPPLPPFVAVKVNIDDKQHITL